jgi:pyridoxamine 5'-phosphate oxidase
MNNNKCDHASGSGSELAKFRTDYALGALDEPALDSNPFVQFFRWFKEAADTGMKEPNAMSLATVDASGRPSCRIVLCKEFDESGFSFYTNYSSRKGNELAKNSHCALLFYWPGLERQVRIEGHAEKTSAKNSDDYFAQRPREAQIAATASRQSETLPDRKTLLDAMAAVEAASGGNPLKRPENWGGYKVVPERFEFWQGRQGRSHDRLCYELQKNGSWQVRRLAP